MPVITGKVVGAEKVERKFRTVGAITNAHTRKLLSRVGRQIITSIRQDATLFTHESAGGLKSSLWTRRYKMNPPTQHLGWGVPYGEVLEWGPRYKKVWDITPTGFRADATQGRSGGGVALKRLRFVSMGKVVYAKKVTHRWTTAEQRPHFTPWLEHYQRGMVNALADIPRRVIEGELR